MKPVEVRSLADEVTQQIKEAIVSGELAPGLRLSEAGLARKLGVSRGPVREALSRLEGSHLVERRTNVGVRVALFDPKDLHELLVVRESLEGMACRLAAENATPEDVAALSSLLEDHARQDEVRSGTGYYQMRKDFDFHSRIIELSGNARLIQMLSVDLYDLLRVHRYKSSTKAGRAQRALEEHRAIVEAIGSRDPDAAESAMRRHLRMSRRSLDD